MAAPDSLSPCTPNTQLFDNDSPPQTPSSEFPEYSEDWRFKQTGVLCEWVEDYRHGGFHPVNLRDTFNDGKYEVIRKLGDGAFSTVWLALHLGGREPKYVALKIMRAKDSATSTELKIHKYLTDNDLGTHNAKHVTVLLDSFWHQGSNGKHLCLLFEPMAVSAAILHEELPQNKPRMFGRIPRYPKRMAKQVLLHTLKGLVFLHTNGVVHGDLQPGNILFSLQNIATIDTCELVQDDSSAVSVQRLDGKTDKWAPTKLYPSQPLHDRVGLGADLCVKVADLGGAFLMTEPPEDTVTPRALRAPELILRQPFGYKIDLWSFGCLIFELLTGLPLFCVLCLGSDQEDIDSADDALLCLMNDRIGPLPNAIKEAWTRYSKNYGPNGELLPVEGFEREPCEPLEESLAELKPDDINAEELKIVCNLIRSILDFDPAKRPSAADLLEHPWFSE